MKNIERARIRTLRMTVIIVLAFIWCWTPYVVMVLWYMFDRVSAEKVDNRLQGALFMMAFSNSCVNPLVYGSYTINFRREFSKCFRRKKKPPPLIRKPTDSTVSRTTNAQHLLASSAPRAAAAAKVLDYSGYRRVSHCGLPLNQVSEVPSGVSSEEDVRPRASETCRDDITLGIEANGLGNAPSSVLLGVPPSRSVNGHGLHAFEGSQATSPTTPGVAVELQGKETSLVCQTMPVYSANSLPRELTVMDVNYDAVGSLPKKSENSFEKSGTQKFGIAFLAFSRAAFRRPKRNSTTFLEMVPVRSLQRNSSLQYGTAGNTDSP